MWGSLRIASIQAGGRRPEGQGARHDAGVPDIAGESVCLSWHTNFLQGKYVVIALQETLQDVSLPSPQ